MSTSLSLTWRARNASASETLGWQLSTDEPQVAGFSFGSAYLVVLPDERAPAVRR